jgi:hypothetical protein
LGNTFNKQSEGPSLQQTIAAHLQHPHHGLSVKKPKRRKNWCGSRSRPSKVFTVLHAQTGDESVCFAFSHQPLNATIVVQTGEAWQWLQSGAEQRHSKLRRKRRSPFCLR